MLLDIGVISFFSFGAVARIVRGQVLSIKEKEYVEAARSLGAGTLRIMFVDILPNVLAPVIVYFTLLVPASIVFEATLSFLGIGVRRPRRTGGACCPKRSTSTRGLVVRRVPRPGPAGHDTGVQPVR